MYCPKCAKSNSDESNFCTKCGYNLKVVTPTGGLEIEQNRVREEDYLRRVLAGRYQIEEEAGRGGMAVVYRARELALDRLVAIKVLPRHLWHNEELVARFLDDAKTAAQLEHPNIVPIFRIGEEPDSCYFVMSYLTGGSMTKLLKDRGKLELPEIISMGVRIGLALSYAHDKGVIHRDIKPGNIMLDSRNRPVVTDFGIAKTTSRTWSTQAGYVIGSPSYMS
ncbi:MAG: protein kinase, partial [Candidatus Glassbacteria bacterium]|nr:protein kinase [Candidatus Glassbacteria bacterium]